MNEKILFKLTWKSKIQQRVTNIGIFPAVTYLKICDSCMSSKSKFSLRVNMHTLNRLAGLCETFTTIPHSYPSSH